MKDIYDNHTRRGLLTRALGILLMVVATVFGATAQNSLPAPGSGGSYSPSPVGGGGGWGPGPGMMGPGMMGPGWGPGPGWGGGWGPDWGYSPTIIVNTPSYVNSGTVNVLACGYDAQGIWQKIPMHVKYYYNGVDYDVTVQNAWNPWTQSWVRHINQPAYSTRYYMRGQTYDYYVPLSTGTYYFNL